jgi:uncharacterized protein (DUF1778 family)
MPTPRRAEAPTKPYPVRLSPAERERIKQAARANHQTEAQFVRDAVMDAAEECLETGDRAEA